MSNIPRRCEVLIKPTIDFVFDWHLTNRCNFYCEYCHSQIRKVLNKEHLDEPSASLVIQRFNEIVGTCAIHMSGGEPFLFPDFVQLCQGLTRRHYISINTNLSIDNLLSFSNIIDPNRVLFINAALHIAERELKNESVNKFIDNIIILQNRRFNVKALYVVYPPLIDRFADDISRLREGGVQRISPKVFKGVYNGKRYPDNYTENEKIKIMNKSKDYQFNKPYLEGQMSFTGQQCTAGKRFFKINVTGDIQRCATVKGNYGNLYLGTFKPNEVVQPCPAKRILVVSQCHDNLVNSPIRL